MLYMLGSPPYHAATIFSTTSTTPKISHAFTWLGSGATGLFAVVKVQSHSDPWFADYANFIIAKFLPPGFTFQQRKKFFTDLRHYFWDDPHLYKEGADGIVRRCIPEHEQQDILRQC